MNKLVLLSMLYFLCLAYGTIAQTEVFVSTVAETWSQADVEVDNAGNIYVSGYDNKIRKINAADSSDEILAVSSDLSYTAGMAFNLARDTLYVSCRIPTSSQGWISKVALDGTVVRWVEGLYYPGDITIDAMGNLYVSQFNDLIVTITPAGDTAHYTQNSLFSTALGIAMAKNDTLFVSSAHTGDIFKVAPTNPPTVSFHAQVNGLNQQWACGFMVYNNNNLFITNGDNIIHRIDMAGQVTDYAGSGTPGGADGRGDTAQFNAPNGIGTSPDGKYIYVAEHHQYRVRALEEVAIEPPTGTGAILPDNEPAFRVYPNPTNGRISLEGSSQKPTRVRICNSHGQLMVEHVLTPTHPQELTLPATNGYYFLEVWDESGARDHLKVLRSAF